MSERKKFKIQHSLGIELDGTGQVGTVTLSGKQKQSNRKNDIIWCAVV